MNALHPIAGYDDRNRLADIIFVHSLNPFSNNFMPIAFETWGENYATGDFWPHWLHQDLKLRPNGLLHTGIWLMEYDASGVRWQKSARDLQNRVAHILALLHEQDIGDKPLLFVCHGIGGLLTTMLLEVGFTERNPLVEQVCGIVFLATPHYGATLTTGTTRLRRFLRLTPAILELGWDLETARRLAMWYPTNAAQKGIQTLSFHAMLPPDVPFLATSPAYPEIESAPIACDPVAIAKLTSRDNAVYQETLRFVREILTAMHPTVPVILPTSDEVTTNDAISLTV